MFFLDSNLYCGGSIYCFWLFFILDMWFKVWKICYFLNGSLVFINIDDDLLIGKFWVVIKKDV